MSGRVLVFPAGMPRSLSFLEQALREGKSVIGSSSLLHDPAKERYPNWCYLPFVTDDKFNQALREVLSDNSIDAIFTPNAVVWGYLKQTLRSISPDVVLLNESPMEQELLPYHKALDFARKMNSSPLGIGRKGQEKAHLDDILVASIFHHADRIPGMCDHEKFRALYEIFRLSPPGDVVEIGSWCGKSAFIIANLAKKYQIGNVLCVDPWSSKNEYMKHEDQGGAINDVDFKAEDSLVVFQMNLALFFDGVLNYLRLPSKEGATHFRQKKNVRNEFFGETAYQGRISVLHIDGNHDYANVKEDVLSWVDMVLPGGWVIFDDYVWPYGDGPKKAGDEFIAEHSESIDCSFVMGSALFVRLCQEIAF